MGELFAQWRNLAPSALLVDAARPDALLSRGPGVPGRRRCHSQPGRLSRPWRKYGRAFQNDHLLPMAAAVWSTPTGRIRDYPAAAMIRFCDNHGLLKVNNRPQWRTVDGGSREYVSRLTAAYADRVKIGRVPRVTSPACRAAASQSSTARRRSRTTIMSSSPPTAIRHWRCCRTQAPTKAPCLGAFKYTRNETILHSDQALMPKRKAIWSSWNYLAPDRRWGQAALRHLLDEPAAIHFRKAIRCL